MASSKSSEETHSVRVWIRPELYTQFSRLCSAQGVSVAAKIRNLMVDSLLHSVTNESEAVITNVKMVRASSNTKHGKWEVTLTLREPRPIIFNLPEYNNALVRPASVRHGASGNRGVFVGNKWRGEIITLAGDASVKAVEFALKAIVLAIIYEQKAIRDAGRSEQHTALDGSGFVGIGRSAGDTDQHSDGEPQV